MARTPLFYQAAQREGARLGITPEEVLERQKKQLQESTYPERDCLAPYEIDLLKNGRSLSSDRLQHIERCTICKMQTQTQQN